MELTFGTSIAMALLSCSCLYFVTSPVTAKCRGRWAIHACFGGNGKRSDPGQSLSNARLPHSRLHQLLASRRHRTVFQDSEDSSPGEERDTLTSEFGDKPDSYTQERAGQAFATTKADISQTLRRLLRYATALRLRDALSSQ